MARAAVVVLGCSASLLATGCGDDAPTATTTAARAATSTAASSTAAAAPGAASVDIASFKFLPASITIAAGGRVTWINRDKAPHTAQNTGEAGAPVQFDSGRLTRGQHQSITFREPGTYHYYCVYHRFMEANVIVR
jgi:plastocyanin